MKKVILVSLFLIRCSFLNAQWIELNGIGFNQPASQVPYYLSHDARSYSDGNNGYVWEVFYNDVIYFLHNELHKYDFTNNTWSKLGEYPEQIPLSVTFSINGVNYCGISYETNHFWKLDTVTSSWTRVADFPGGPRYGPGSFVANGKGYVVAGGFNSIIYDDCWEYDPATDIWTQKNNFQGTARIHALSWSNDSIGFIGLGSDSTGTVNDLWKYNPVNDSWTSMTDYPGALQWQYITFSIGQKIFLHTDNEFWQFDDSSNAWSAKTILDTLQEGAVGFSNQINGYILHVTGGLSLNKYDPVADSWTNIMKGVIGEPNVSNLNEPGVVFDNKAHIKDNSNKNFIYDPLIDTWTPDTTSNLSWLFSINNKGYALLNNVFKEFDPVSGNWTTKNQMLPGLQFFQHLFVINNKSYNLLDSAFVTAIWEYDLNLDQWTNIGSLPGGLTGGYGSVGFAIGNFGYFGLGGTWYDCSTDSIFKYDPAFNSWSFETRMPLGRRSAAIGLSDNTYGYIGFGVECPGAANGDNGNLFVYNPANQSWKITTPIDARNTISGFCIDNKIYLGGGWQRTCQSCEYSYVPFDFYSLDTAFFSNYHLLSGSFYLDLNQNGVQDSAENNMAGNGFQISPDSGQFVSQAYGHYSYYLPNGNYSISASPVFGYHITNPLPSYSVTMNGTDISNIDFGFYPDNVISGHTYFDMNLNGVRDSLDSVAAFIRIIVDTLNLSIYSNFNDGMFEAVLPNGPRNIYVSPPINCHLTSLPPVYSFTLNNDTLTNIDFGFYYNYSMSGYTYADMNQNGVRDSADVLINDVGIIVTPSVASLITNNVGFYSFTAADTDYTIAPVIPNGFHLTSNPSTYQVNGGNVNIDSLDFGIFPDVIVPADVEAFITSGFPRCNTNVSFYLNASNNGIGIASGIIKLIADSTMAFTSAVPSPDSSFNNTYYWHFSGVGPFSDLSIVTANFILPGAGSTLNCEVFIYALDSIGSVIDSSGNVFSRLVSCSFDPNEKLVNPEQNQSTLPGDWLTYEIHFQNTGNDTAFKVMIIDTLDANLDLNSLEILSGTHFFLAEIRNGNILVLTFENILLPDSNVNVSGSQGHIMYRVKTSQAIISNTTIYNTAYIYFDYNSPVKTNTTVSLIDLTTISVEEVDDQKIFVYPNPSNLYSQIIFPDDDLYNVRLFDMNGNVIKTFGRYLSNGMKLETGNLPPGNYILNIQKEKTAVEWKVKLLVIKN